MGTSASKKMDDGSIFNYEVQDGNDQLVSLSSMRGKKAYLIVNTAGE